MKCNLLKMIVTSVLLSAISLGVQASPATPQTTITPNADTFPEILIFISPHPDDIPLTFAGLIQRNGGFINHSNQILDIFSRSQWTENTDPDDLSKYRIDTVSRERKTEDRLALKDMFHDHLSYKYYGYPDAPIRQYHGPKTAGGGPAGNFSTFGPQEKSIYTELVPIMETKLKTPNCAMFVLMANGYHIDHFIVREAVITAARNLGDKALCQIYFGEDQPYTGAFIDASQKQMQAFSNRLNLQKISYEIDKNYKESIFTKYYISQYSPDYIKGIDKWDTFDKHDEDIYLWPKEDYAKAPIEEHCTEAFCK